VTGTCDGMDSAVTFLCHKLIKEMETEHIQKFWLKIWTEQGTGTEWSVLYDCTTPLGVCVHCIVI